MTTNTPYGSVFWLGGYRNYAAPYKKQSSWLWSDGAEMNFTAWAPGQPNNFWSDRVSIDIIISRYYLLLQVGRALYTQREHGPGPGHCAPHLGRPPLLAPGRQQPRLQAGPGLSLTSGL